MVGFTSADINFYKFLTSFNIIWKKIFITDFPFLTDSLKCPTPLTAEIEVWQKFFVDAP